jgi:hypothetical protein
MLYLILIMECFAMWPFPRAHVSMIGFMGKNKDDDNNSDPVFNWSLCVLRDVLYGWFYIQVTFFPWNAMYKYIKVGKGMKGLAGEFPSFFTSAWDGGK